MSVLMYKIVAMDTWRAAEQAGKFTGAGVDIKDGFIHFSSIEQVRNTAARFFHGVDGLALVAIDTEPLQGKIKWEASGSGILFPHLYEPLETKYALWAKPLPLLSDGSHDFTGLL